MSTITFSSANGTLLGTQADTACSVLNDSRFKAAQLALNDGSDLDRNDTPGEVYVPSGTNPPNGHVKSGVTGRVSFDPAHPPKESEGMSYVGGPIDGWEAKMRHKLHMHQPPDVSFSEGIDTSGFSPSSFDGVDRWGTRYTYQQNGTTEIATQQSGGTTYRVEADRSSGQTTLTIVEP